IGIAPEPDALTECRTEAAAAATAVTLVTSRQTELFHQLLFFGELGVFLIRAMQSSRRNLLHELYGRRRIAGFAADFFPAHLFFLGGFLTFGPFRLGRVLLRRVQNP